MSRFRELGLLSGPDSARLAARFPRSALNLLWDCATGVAARRFPRRLGLFVTNRCNFACPMCAVRDAREEGLARGGDMPFEIVERVMAECSRYQPIVDFIGGEPLLYPRLQDAIRLSFKRGVPSVVTTNGLTLQETAGALVAAGLPFLQVSLDGWDEPSQAARGGVKGSFARLCDGLRAVRQARGSAPFPIVRILTAITRVNHAQLERIQRVVAELGVRYWAISNYFYLNRNDPETYLTPEQVRDLKRSLARVRQSNRRLRLRIAYAWNIDLERYYSACRPSRSCRCDLPYTRLDVHTDGHMAVCVSGAPVGQAGRQSIAEVWRGSRMETCRATYERTRPMPMCFRCCGLSQSIRF